jgi:hypothetical protein
LRHFGPKRLNLWKLASTLKVNNFLKRKPFQLKSAYSWKSDFFFKSKPICIEVTTELIRCLDNTLGLLILSDEVYNDPFNFVQLTRPEFIFSHLPKNWLFFSIITAHLLRAKTQSFYSVSHFLLSSQARGSFPSTPRQARQKLVLLSELREVCIQGIFMR